MTSDLSNRLKGSLLLFTKFFYKLRTGREFEIPEPKGREPRHITISKELTKVFHGETQNLLINIQPGAGKSELLIHFVAWAMTRCPDSNFLYVSHTKSLAEGHTHTIKQILEMPEYKALFDVRLRKDSTAKGHFKTTSGGQVAAFGSAGAITGHNAGLPNLDRFSGGLIIDDAHKPDEVHSDTLREGVWHNYNETLVTRLRGPKVPIIGIGQRLHEADLFGEILSGKDGREWRKVILKTIDEAGNNLCPDVISMEELRNKQETSPYVYASQYQQNPQPAGGGIFKPEWFPLLDYEPNILETFITADTAETSKTHNDATVFSFWGVYQVEYNGELTGEYAIHWMDCHECWIEPKDLQNEFMYFYTSCMRHRVKPKMAAIEKKSTGTTLVSLLSDIQGIRIIDIERTRESGSKTKRFLDIQAYIASKQVTLPVYGKHSAKCIEHMRKITANDTHRYDDIADTCADAVKIALVDKFLINIDNTEDPKAEKIIATMNRAAQKRRRARISSWQTS